MPNLLADVATQGRYIGEGITQAGKALTFGVALGLSGFGAAIGIGMIFSSMIGAVARQPELRGELNGIMWLGFALVEAIVFYGLLGALMGMILVS